MSLRVECAGSGEGTARGLSLIEVARFAKSCTYSFAENILIVYAGTLT